MRPLALDFVDTRPPRFSTGLAFLLAGMVALSALFYEHAALKAGLDAREARIGLLEKTRTHTRKNVHAEPPDAAQQSEIRRANMVIDQLNLPWAALFQAVESASDGTIALLSIQPDAQKQSVRITGEAKKLEDVLGYIERLQDDTQLINASLLSHEIRQQDAEKPVRFTLTANWMDQ